MFQVRATRFWCTTVTILVKNWYILKEKLEAYVRAQQAWASAYAQRQVPALVMGGAGAGETDRASTDFAQMMQLLVAQQIGLDLSVPKSATRSSQ